MLDIELIFTNGFKSPHVPIDLDGVDKSAIKQRIMHIDLDKFERIEKIGFNFDGKKIKGIRLYSPNNRFDKSGEYFIDSIWDQT